MPELPAPRLPAPQPGQLDAPAVDAPDGPAVVEPAVDAPDGPAVVEPAVDAPDGPAVVEPAVDAPDAPTVVEPAVDAPAGSPPVDAGSTDHAAVEAPPAESRVAPPHDPAPHHPAPSPREAPPVAAPGDQAGPSAARGEPVVSAAGLTRRFGDHEVLHGLDLQLAPGTILGLIGPSGCGKTTTVRLLTGLLTPTSGTATVFGRPATELTAADRSRIGYLPQTPALFPELSLDENLSFHASMYGLPFRRGQRLTRLLEWVELDGHRRKRVANASGGMQRRLALAASFVHDPDVVFLDEPTAGIDPILRDKLWVRFRELAERGKALIVTTQYVGEAGQCDLVGLLSEGELLLVDTPSKLRWAAYEGEVLDVLPERPLTDADLRTLGAHDVVKEVERAGPTRVRVAVDDADACLATVREAVEALGVRVVEIDEHLVDYDEAFVRIVERHRGAAARELQESAS